MLTNLSPVWVGVISFLFLNFRPKQSFWLGTLIVIFGMIVFVGMKTILELNFDFAFFLGVLYGIFYALYILVSKNSLQKIDVITFLSYSMLVSSIFLFVICWINGEKFLGYSQSAWISLFIQGIVCQLIAWILISYATKRMKATRVSLSLLSQILFAAILAAIFVNEEITVPQIVGGIIIMIGIATTFYEKKGFEN